MSNILVDELPGHVIVNGKPVAINTDFKSCLKTILAFEDNELTPQEKYQVLLSNLYTERPENAREALEKGLWFLNGGSNQKANDDAQPRIYSFEKDANYIFAAFRQTHGIDLYNAASLHWWVFLALFMDLGSETTFCQLASLRKRVKTGKATKEERAIAREMDDAFDISEIDTRTLDEKEQEREFMRLVQERHKK